MHAKEVGLRVFVIQVMYRIIQVCIGKGLDLCFRHFPFINPVLLKICHFLCIDNYVILYMVKQELTFAVCFIKKPTDFIVIAYHE